MVYGTAHNLNSDIETITVTTTSATVGARRNVSAADAADLKKLAKQAGEAARLLKLLANEKRLLRFFVSWRCAARRRVWAKSSTW